MTATSAQPMTRDEFYKRFPWVFDLPSHPTCSECLLVGYYHFEDGWVLFVEGHTEVCSHTDKTETKLYPFPTPPGLIG